MPAYFKADAPGVLSSDWADHLGEEVQPFQKVLNERFGNMPVDALARSYGEANLKLSQGGRVLPYPSAEAKPEEIQAWKDAQGIEAEFNAEQYNLRPENAPEHFSDEVAGKFGQLFHQIGVPPQMAKSIAEGFIGIEGELAQQAQQAYNDQLEADRQALYKELGPGYQEKMEDLKAAAHMAGVDPSDPGLFDNPNVIRFMNHFVGLLGEDRIASMRESAGNASPTEAAYAEAMRIMTDDTHPEYAAYQQAGPNDPIALRVNRALARGQG